MKACFDTSTLIAALLQQHPHHAVAFPRLQSVRNGELQGCVTTHGLAELFATLTALPLKPRLSAADAQRVIEQSVLPSFIVIALTAEHYRAAIQLAATRNLASGAIYDALHLIGARAADCSILYTINLRHFRALAPGDALIVSP